MSFPGLYSLVFLITSIIFFLCGIHVLMSNLKSELNRLFFAIAISLAIWSLGFAGGNIAVDYTHALIWRRVAAIGWGPLYCLVLHYFILLTENHALLKKWWSYAILYFPAAVSVIVFSVAGNIAVNQYELFYSPSGWINVQKANFWDNAFSVHYICYSLVELLLIWKWGRRTDDNNKERQSRVIIISLFVALILGTLTDTILNKLLVADIPQLGPVSALVALGVIYAYIKRYGIKAKMSKNQIAEPGKILSEVGQEKLYLVISMVFVAGGLINFIFQFYFFHARFASVAPLCVILISIGFVFFLIPQLPLKGYPRDVILIVTVIASIPLMSLRYISNAGITVWAAPFIFVVLSVVFNRKRMMLWLLSSVLATQVWIWYKSPVAIVRVD
ncbi:MAG: hypothetical protein HGA22_11600, partial [Clostridiales bacterium]|nr:hypothetical protein [Clostridiales bacterium]